jgi:multidrug transporter EmrE-like cation transporter
MTLQVIVYIVLSAMLTVAANLMMRYGLVRCGGFVLRDGGVAGLVVRLLGQPFFLLGFLCYGMAALVWFKVLSIAEVSSSYPMLVGLTFVLVTVGAILLFNESVSVLKVTGILVVLAGIILIARA